MTKRDGIFNFRDYRDYLKWVISQRPGGGRGIRFRMAQAMFCQPSFISKVLKGNAHFSLEQADAINAYLGHDAEESHFFILLVQAERAGSPSLKRYFDAQLKALHEKRTNLDERLKIQNVLSVEDQSRYYSAWYFIAIHLLVSIEKFQTKEALARHLNLPLKKVSEALVFLSGIGMVRKTHEGRYELGVQHIHLTRDSPLLTKHHTNWRIQAIRSLDVEHEGNLHYSVVMSISDADIGKIRALSVDFIEEVLKVARPSVQKGLHCFGLDFFHV